MRERTEDMGSSDRISDRIEKAMDLAEANCGAGCNAFISLYDEKTVKERLKQVEERKKAGDPHLSILAGMPLAVKDNICTKGVLTTCASRMLENFVPMYEATVMERLERAGLIPIGKTNMDEFGMGSTSETSFFGSVRHPLEEGLVPGGSSGGSAAAVAAGIVPVALGTDTGGSIRQPAAHCGVYGLKPTYGAVSRYGLIAYASSMDQIGPIAAKLSELEEMFRILAGVRDGWITKDDRDATSRRERLREREVTSANGEASTGVESLRIGIPKGFFAEDATLSFAGGENGRTTSVDMRILEKVRAVAEKLEKQGATVEEFEPDRVTSFMVPAYSVIACAEASSNLERYDGVKYGFRYPAGDVSPLSGEPLPEDTFSGIPTGGAKDESMTLKDMYKRTRREGFGEEVRRRLMLGTFVLSRGYYDAYYLRACRVRDRIRLAYQKAFERYDAILTPVAPATAPKIGESLADPVAMYMSDLYTVPANLTGMPAISFPCGKVDGMPVGAQLMADHFCEKTLFKVVAAYEE